MRYFVPLVFLWKMASTHIALQNTVIRFAMCMISSNTTHSIATMRNTFKRSYDFFRRIISTQIMTAVCFVYNASESYVICVSYSYLPIGLFASQRLPEIFRFIWTYTEMRLYCRLLQTTTFGRGFFVVFSFFRRSRRRDNSSNGGPSLSLLLPIFPLLHGWGASPK